MPDPASADTFESAKLSWSWPEGSEHAALRRLYQDLLRARRDWPAMRDFGNRSARLLDGNVIEFTRGRGPSALRAFFNLSDRSRPLPSHERAGEALLFTSEAPQYGGSRSEMAPGKLLPFECRVLEPARGSF